jgi:sugar phosphate isomerase/epimerase
MMKPLLALTSRVDARNWKGVAGMARSAGFAGIDWNLDYFRIPAASNARQRFYDAAAASGLPSGFHGPCQDVELGHSSELVSMAARSYLKMYVDFISHFGGTHMTVHLGSRSIPMAEMDWTSAVEGLRDVSDYARTRGVRICLENLKQGWMSEPELVWELAEAADTSITFDVGHARGSSRIREGRDTLESYMRPLLPRIANLHVYEVETPEGIHAEPSSLDNIRPALELALDVGAAWWVIELDNYDAILRVKSLIDTGF